MSWGGKELHYDINMEFILLIIIVVIVAAALGVSREDEVIEQYVSLKNSIIAKFGEPTKIIDDGGKGDNETVYVFEGPQIIVIKGKEHRFDSLLDFSINGGPSYKITTSSGSAIGRGLVGGVLLGGVGALAGAGTASKKATANNSDYVICITTKDLSNPMIEYRTKSDTRANELASVL